MVKSKITLSGNEPRRQKNFIRITSITLIPSTILILAISFLSGLPAALVPTFAESNVVANSQMFNVTNIPTPPTAIGCYSYVQSSATWRIVQCLSASVSSTIPHPTEGGSFGVTGEASTKIFTKGAIAVIPTDPSGVKDLVYGSGAYSIQANTNGFTNGGKLYATQFTIQNSPTADYFCIWTVDVTDQKYPNKCLSIPIIQAKNIIFGIMFGSTQSGKVTNEFCSFTTSISTTGCWSITKTDTSGLGTHWKGITGSILGYGGGSQVNFLGTSPQLIVQTDIYKPTSPLVSGEIGANTVETNNLHYVGSPTTSFSTTDWSYVTTTSSK
jgi:hypothetical protein